jgi:UDP-N-acetylglucosamine--dolichyl-phosphate N-acetylglucosaminephosphotransferase
MFEFVLILVAAFFSTLIATPWIIKRLEETGHVVKDMNKLGHPKVPEMGGLSVVGGFIVGVLVAIGLQSFGFLPYNFNLTLVLAGLAVVLITALIGIIDDLLRVNQKIKALLPILAALPLVAVKAGVTSMTFPFIGTVELGLIYAFIIIPLAITGASNAMNMLAGFNGLESGLGLVMCGTVALASIYVGGTESLILTVAMLGSLVAFLKYNWCPAKILIGDVGTFSIGALVASAVIIGNIERVGVILIIPFFIELFLKARSRFQAQSFCLIEGDKLICKKRSEVYGLGRLVMHLTGGVRETTLVSIILLLEMVFALIAVWSVL